MPERASFTTHLVDIGEGEVVKRFRSWDRGEHVREWQALTLLARYAPDLAPAPLSADLASVPPRVRMSRVPGLPLDGLPLDGHAVTPGHLDAVAAAISRLHAAVPRDVSTRVTGTWPTTCGTASGSGWSISRTRAAATGHTSWPRSPSTCRSGTTPGSRPERCSAA